MPPSPESDDDDDDGDGISNQKRIDDMLHRMALGCHVEVEDRLWPGSNKPGGMARVTGIHVETKAVDLHYVVEGRRKEKRVDLKHVIRLAPEFDFDLTHDGSGTASTGDGENNRRGNILRDRSLLLGRCTHCGSLRADCGSCDWMHAKEQEQQGATDDVSTGIKRSANGRKSKRTRREENKRGEEKRDTPNASASADRQVSSSSYDEDKELEELIGYHQLEVQRLKRQKSRQERELQHFFIEQERETNEALARAQARNLRDASTKMSATQTSIHCHSEDSYGSGLGSLNASSDSVGDDDELIPLAELALRDARGIAKGHRKDQQTYMTSTERKTNQIHSEYYHKNKRQKNNKNRQYRSAFIFNDGGNDYYTRNSSYNIHDDNQEANKKDNAIVDEVHTDPSGSEIIAENRRPGICAEMEDFIEPEGHEVAGNLPEDIVDGTSDVVYAQLPKFFDDEAARIEGILLPDTKIQVDQLQREINCWTEQQGKASIGSPVYTRKGELLASCKRAIKNITANVIRSGTDQCRSALRQLIDDSRYKSERKNLSLQERKEMRRHRGDNLLSIRDSRMDDMDRVVEQLIRRVRQAEESLLFEEVENEKDFDDNDLRSGDGSGCQLSDGDNGNMIICSGDEKDNDNAACNSLSRGSTEGSFTPLSPWNPHMYARSVRPPISEAEDLASSGKNHQEGPRHKAFIAGPEKKPARHSDSSGLADSRRRRKTEPGKRNRQNDVTAASNSSDMDEISDQLFLQQRRRQPREGTRARRAVRRQEQPPARNNKAFTGLSSGIDASRVARDASIREDGGDIDTNVSLLKDVFSGGNRDPPPGTRYEIGQRTHTSRTTSICHQKPIAERNQAFLDADNVHIDRLSDSTVPDTQQSGKTRNEQLKSKRNRPQSGNFYRGSSEGTHYTSVKSHHLFARLGGKQPLLKKKDAVQAEKEICENLQDLRTLCESLLNTCPNNLPDAFVAKLKELSIVSTTNTECQDLHLTAELVFRTVLKLMQNQEAPTLQEVITGFRKWPLRCHITLLTEVLNLIGKGLNAHLRHDDNLVYDVFVLNPHKRFVGFVVLQLVDSLYSIFHPVAWGAGGAVPVGVLNSLIPLRDALAKVSPLTEYVCECISGVMPNQTWWLAKASPLRAYVSAVDPRAWWCLLYNGSDLPSPKYPRLSHFNGSVFPRCEANALWSVLAFVAGAPPSGCEKKKLLCWRLASKVTLRGALWCGKQVRLLPPSESQLRCCEQELSFLASLLQAGAAGIAPKDDKTTFSIIKAAATLQGDDYKMNERSRANAYPACEGRAHKVERKKLQALWDNFLDGKISLTQKPQQEKLVLEIPAAPGATQFGQPMLLPSSLLSRQCLTLFVGWIQKVPGKRARFNRLAKEIRTLLNEVAAQAYASNDTRIGAESGFFALAFSKAAARKTIGSGPERKKIFLLEFAAYLSVLAAVAVQYSVTSNEAGSAGSLAVDDAATKVWDTLANDAMKRRCKDNALSPRGALYQEDEYRLYITSRAITFAALVVMGVPAWSSNLDKLPNSPTCPAYIVAPHDDSLVHLTTCLITCLDCHCDLQGSRVVMTSLCTNITLVFSHAFHMFSSSLLNPDFKTFLPSLRALARVSLPCFEKTFKRCFHIVTRESLGGDESGLCLLGALTALRAASIFSAHVHNETAPAVRETTPTTTSVDSNCVLFTFLAEALLESKPSKRFATLDGTPNTTGTWKMCSLGRELIAKQRRRACNCLAALSAKEDSAAGRELSVFLSQTGFSGQLADCEDKLYQDDLVHSTSVALCDLSSAIPHCSSFIRSNSELVLFSLVDEVLDFKALEQFPTCTLCLTRQTSCMDWAGHGYGSMKAATPASGNLISRPVRWSMWNFCSKLGVALGHSGENSDNGGVESVLAEVLNPDSSTRSFVDDCSFNLQAFSLENECIQRFQLLTSIVTIFSTSNETQKFERICSRIVERSTSHMLFAWNKLSEMEGHNTHFRPNLTELITSYCDVHIALLSWVLRRAQRVPSVGFESLLQSIRSRYLLPVLHGNAHNLLEGMHEVKAMASPAGPRKSHLNPSASTGSSKFSVMKILRQSIIRRSRELFLHASNMPEQAGGLLDAIVVAGIGKISAADDDDLCVAETVASALSSDAPRYPVGMCSSPLQESVDEYLGTIQKISSTEARGLKELKQKVLVSSLLPRLRWRQATADTKLQQQIFLFVRRIIDSESGAAFSLDDRDGRVSCQLSLRDLARGLSQSLRFALVCQLVDSGLVCSIFSCVQSLAASWVVSCDDAQHSMFGTNRTTVAQWSQSASLPSSSSSEPQVIPLCLWHVFLWLKAVAELLVDQSEGESIRLLNFRLQLQRDERAWPLVSPELQKSLRETRTRLFPQKTTHFNIVNVYAKKTQGRNSAETPGMINGQDKMTLWSPNESVRRTAKHFVAKLIPRCY